MKKKDLTSKKHNFKWSDGSPVTLQEGQRWQDPASTCDIARIIKIKGDQVTYALEAIEELNRTGKSSMNPQDTQPIEGTDGFLDFLESCCYQLLP